jgi:polyisoprenyl-teichoic acid--peptidoglycan teichoic acid transferase
VTWRAAPRLLAALLGIALLASVTWTVVAIRTIAPNAGPGDLFGQSALAKKTADNERVNLLFMAHGGAGGDNPDFTDTMLVLSIRPSTHRATVISLPRYLLVDIPASPTGAVQGKLYSAYALGAEADRAFLQPRWTRPTGPGDLAAATVGATIGQPIDRWVSVDIAAFQALIDAVGGVRVNIPEALDDPQYPSDVDEQTIHIHFDAGPQTLDGKRALEYARSRLSTSESDRSRRQEIVLFAVLQKLKMSGLTNAPSLLATAGELKDGVRTDLTLAEMQDLRHVLGTVNEGDVTAITLEDSPLLEKKTLSNPGAEVLVPTSGSYDELRAFVASRLP